MTRLCVWNIQLDLGSDTGEGMDCVFMQNLPVALDVSREDSYMVPGSPPKQLPTGKLQASPQAFAFGPLQLSRRDYLVESIAEFFNTIIRVAYERHSTP